MNSTELEHWRDNWARSVVLQLGLMIILLCGNASGGWTNRWETSYGGERPGGADDIAEAATMGSGGHVFVGGPSRSTVDSGTTETLVVRVDPVSGKPLWEFRSSSVGIENATVSRIEVVDAAEVLVALGGHSSSRKDFALLRLGEASGDVRFVVPSYRSLLGWQTIDGWSKRPGSLFVAGNSGGPGRSEVSVAEIRLSDGQVSWISTLTIPELEGATVEQIALDLGVADKLGLLMEVKDLTTHAKTTVVSLVDTAERSNLWMMVMPNEKTLGIGGLAVGKTGDVAFWTRHPAAAGEEFSRLTCLSGADGAELWQSIIPTSKEAIAIVRDREDNLVLLNHLRRSHTQSVEKINGRTGVLSWDSMVTVYFVGFSSDAATDLVVDRAGDIAIAIPTPRTFEDRLESYVVKLSGVDGSVLWKAGERTDLGYRFGTLQESGVLLVVGTGSGDFAVEALDWTSGMKAWGIRYDGMIYGREILRDACVDNVGAVCFIGEGMAYSFEDGSRLIVGKVAQDGSVDWIREFAAEDDFIVGWRILADGVGNLYVTGHRSDKTDRGFLLKLSESNGAVIWETPFASGGYVQKHLIAKIVSASEMVAVASLDAYPGKGYSIRAMDANTGSVLWSRTTVLSAGESFEIVDLGVHASGDILVLWQYRNELGETEGVLERLSGVSGDLDWERRLGATQWGQAGYSGLKVRDLSQGPSGVVGVCGSITNASTGLPEMFCAVVMEADGGVKWHTTVESASKSEERGVSMLFNPIGEVIASIETGDYRSGTQQGLSLVKLGAESGDLVWRNDRVQGDVANLNLGIGQVLATGAGTYVCSSALVAEGSPFRGGYSGFILTEVYDDDGSEAWSEAFDVSRIEGGLKMLSLGDSQFCVLGDSVRGRRDLFAMGLGRVDELRVRVRRKSTGVELRVAGLGADRGSVERSEDLVAWTQLGDIASNEVFLDPHPPVRQSFYRVVKSGGDGATRD